ncbi:MAG: SDR family NAD(P)-dependent oxidoreductase [Rhodospirillales bacterium]|nr:MAG: SDR family NAD(P)-dependent oxidoreductase [Rhodospirillales bacterium]
MTEPFSPGGDGRLAGRIALITGASRGIGRAVALGYAREGAHVILVARTQAALEELDDEIRAGGGRASLVPADLTEPGVIDRIGGAVYQRWGRLDILVGNAGTLGVLTPVPDVAPDVWDQVIALNLTANWRLIRSLDPLLRAADAGRAIFVTSGVSTGRAYWGPYAVSKAALETLVRTYAAEIAKTAIRANLIDPGATRTRMRGDAYPGEDPGSVKPPEALTEVFVALALPECTRNGEVVRADDVT